MSQTPPQKSFSTWRALYGQMLADLADGAWRTMSGYSVAGRSVSYRGFAEFKEMLEWVKAQADQEDGVRPFRRRTFAGNRGRGC